jgi:hypothetical protein
MNNHYTFHTKWTEKLLVPMMVSSLYSPVSVYLTHLRKDYIIEKRDDKEWKLDSRTVFGAVCELVQKIVAGIGKAYRLKIVEKAVDLFVWFANHPQTLVSFYPEYHPLLYICAVATAVADVVTPLTSKRLPCMYSAADVCGIVYNGRFTANQLLQMMMQWSWLQERK